MYFLKIWIITILLTFEVTNFALTYFKKACGEFFAICFLFII